MTADRYLVPVSESVTLRNTVAYAIRSARDGADGDDQSAVHFVYPVSRRVEPGVTPEEVASARELLDRVAAWAAEDLGDAGPVTVETAIVGTDEYLFSPGDYADVLVEYARDHDLATVVFDPEYAPFGTTPLLPPLLAEVERTDLLVREAPVERERRSALPSRRGSVGEAVTLFGVSYVFYLLLAESVTPFELATGAVTAAVVAATLRRVSFVGPLDARSTVAQAGRMALYAPYLMWEIARTNVQLAATVLHPDLPIDPEMVEFEAAVGSELAVTTLANSITLTPGDLTVDVTRRHFTVHVLTPADRDNLLAGTLERPVRFVFHGRAGARTPTPAERRQRRTEES